MRDGEDDGGKQFDAACATNKEPAGAKNDRQDSWDKLIPQLVAADRRRFGS